MIAYLRLENIKENHFKFYEMTLIKNPRGTGYNVVVRYGRINTEGKTLFLKGNGLPKRGAEAIDGWLAKRAFLSQLKKKFRDKAYNLEDLKVNDDWLESEILSLQDQFEDGLFNRIAELLEDRGF